MSETYTPGYSPRIVAFMAARSAEHQARFLLPHLRPGLRLLDVGCGPGTITAGLAKAVAPGEVTGMDRAESQLDLAREHAALQGANNAKFVCGSVYELPFADGEFDVVLAHAVFEHLKEPVAALREIHRVLKPGGLAALRSPDWGGFIPHPATPELEAAMKYYQKIQTANGGDVFAGRKLKDWALSAKFDAARWSGSFEFAEDIVGITDFIATQLEIHSARPDLGLDPETLARFTSACRRLPNEQGALLAGSWGEVIAFKN